MTNKDIARALSETGSLIELTGGNAFRARAFERAARSIRGLETPASERLDDGTLTDVDGVGDAMADHVRDLLATGSFEQRDELLNAVPTGLLDVLRVKGLGVKKVRALWDALNVTSLDELEQAAVEDRITDLSGFGTKTQQNIIENVRRLRRYLSRSRYRDALHSVTPLLDAYRNHPSVDRAELTGALRRQMETVERARLLVVGAPDVVKSVLAEHVSDDPVPIDDGFEGTLPDGLPVRVHRTASDRFGLDWWHTTGSEAHCAALVDAYGAPSPHADEADVFAEAGLDRIPPELRENRGELEAAASGSLPSLITTDDLRGSLHNHSTYSDGAHSLRQMAEAARSRGLEYFGIADHSQSLRVASGLTPEEVRAQRDEVDALNADLAASGDRPFRIFHGIESDVLSDGSLDYDDDVLASFDYVVASIHSGFNMTVDDATARIVTAVENPHTTILGHPTGRLLLVREGYSIDHGAVLDACAAHDVAIELNANPYRLDVDWRYVQDALDRGVLVSINPDAHATDELDNVRWGVAVARKGWLTADQCLNAKSLDAFTAWLERRQPSLQTG